MKVNEVKFEPVKTNNDRQVELDMAKFLAILFMILNHCLMVTEGFNNSVSHATDMIIGHLLGCPFSAPVFMFCMGMGIVYSRNSAPGKLIRRGIKLMLLGTVVNVGEFFLPHYLSGALLGMWDVFPIAGGLLLFCIDILAFAGMALISIGILKRLKLSDRVLLVVAIAMSVIGSFIRFTDTGSDITNLIAGYFFGSAGGFTAFPLFNWFIIAVSGYLFGKRYIACSDRRKLLRF